MRDALYRDCPRDVHGFDGERCPDCPHRVARRPDGLTPAEGRVADAAVEMFNAYAALPVEHPDELSEVAQAVHRVQGWLAMRIARRHHPAGWPNKGPR